MTVLSLILPTVWWAGRPGWSECKHNSQPAMDLVIFHMRDWVREYRIHYTTNTQSYILLEIQIFLKPRIILTFPGNYYVLYTIQPRHPGTQ